MNVKGPLAVGADRDLATRRLVTLADSGWFVWLAASPSARVGAWAP